MKYSNGYNMTPGGHGVSDETRAKMSVLFSGAGNPMYGKPGTRGNLGNKLSKEQRERISVARNLALADRGGTPLSREQYDALSVKFSGEGNPMYGKCHSQEKRAEITKKLNETISAMTPEERAAKYGGDATLRGRQSYVW
jgi:hypothetical protein